MKKTTKIISIILALVVAIIMISPSIRAAETEEDINFIKFPKKLVNNEGTIERVHGILQDEREFTKEQVDAMELVYEAVGITQEEYNNHVKVIELLEKVKEPMKELQDLTDNLTVSITELEGEKTLLI